MGLFQLDMVCEFSVLVFKFGMMSSFQLYDSLRRWRPVTMETALALLDCKSADILVSVGFMCLYLLSIKCNTNLNN